ncbi:hypothetical protein [Aestuariivirga sp.]|uniref:hypothetical protein n=1 Tax=Aestuariivirga sp. TaxID=2650926 RepID=UPI0037840DD6
MTAFVEFLVDCQGQAALWPLRDDDLGASGVQYCDDPVGIEGLAGNQALELNASNPRRDAAGAIALAGQQHEAHGIAKRAGQGKDFRRPAAFRSANGLILGPPFAPWRWR